MASLFVSAATLTVCSFFRFEQAQWVSIGLMLLESSSRRKNPPRTMHFVRSQCMLRSGIQAAADGSVRSPLLLPRRRSNGDVSGGGGTTRKPSSSR
eukprot:3368529-Pleurochrysis_carterae.AAC.1